MALTEKQNPMGRTKMKIEINFADPLKNFQVIERLSKLEGMPKVLKVFGNALIDLSNKFEEDDDKPNDHNVNIDAEDYNEGISEHKEQEPTSDRAYELIKQVLESIDDGETIGKLIKPFLYVLNYDQKIKVLSEITTEIVEIGKSMSNSLIYIIQQIIVKFNLKQQTEIYSFLGNLLNPSIFESSNKLPTAHNLTTR